MQNQIDERIFKTSQIFSNVQKNRCMPTAKIL